MGVLLETRQLCKDFGGLKAVHDVSMQVQTGEIHGIIGPNGAGKTTLFNLLTGSYQPTSGEVLFHGQSITGLPPEKVARLGIVRTFQNIRLFKSMTVLENVQVGLHIRTGSGLADAILHTPRFRKDEGYARERGRELLARVNLTAFAHEPAGSLPYGSQRRLEIARALAAGPELLLLDEPAAGMNPVETRELMEFIRQLAGDGLTIVVIEHDMRLIMNVSNNITVLNHGEKICQGPPAQVQRDPAVVEAYLGKGRGAVC